jgi:hypothetical protein
VLSTYPAVFFPSTVLAYNAPKTCFSATLGEESDSGLRDS